MDLFVYGCTRVLRYISILKGTVLCYDTAGIFQHLNINADHFKQIISLSGTDYNMENNINIHKCFEYYETYKNDMHDNKSFYNWLEKKNVIKNSDDLTEICESLTPIFTYIMTKSRIQKYETAK